MGEATADAPHNTSSTARFNPMVPQLLRSLERGAPPLKI